MSSGEPAVVAFSPSAELPQLTEHELAVLGQVGRAWPAGLPESCQRTEGLPIDLGLTQYPAPTPGRFSRIAQLEQFRVEAPGQLLADQAEPVRSPGGVIRRALLGPPLNSAAVVEERFRKLVALPVL